MHAVLSGNEELCEREKPEAKRIYMLPSTSVNTDNESRPSSSW